MDTEQKKNIAVVGAGIIGVMSAWQLTEQGHSVTVYEQWNTPNDRGASAGESRIFRTLYKEGPEYVKFIQDSGNLWKELEEKQDTQVLQWCGGLTIGRPEHPDVKAVLDCAEELGLEYRVLDPNELRTEYPAYGVDDDEIAVLDPNAGVFRPELAVLAARNESIAGGAEYHSYEKVLNIRPFPEGVVVYTENGAFHYDSVVVASGPWASRLHPNISGLPNNAIFNKQLVASWFATEDVNMHSPENMPISIRRHPEGAFSSFPCLDGMAVKILNHHLEWPVLEDIDALDRFVGTSFVRSTEAAVRRLMPHLDTAPLRVSTWTEGFTVDGAPIVGPSLSDSRVILAVGMSGQGFKFAPMVGKVVADFVSKGRSEDALEIMHPQRFGAKV